MGSENGQYTVAPLRAPRPHGLLAVLLILAACVTGGCQTVTTRNDALIGLQEWSMLDPPSRLLSAHEMPQEKAEMVHWLEQYLRGEYHVIDQRFVLTEPGFTEWALLESKAGQYMEQERGAIFLRQEWKETGIDLVSLWRLDQASPRHFALVMTDEPLPSQAERSLVGYFELMPSTK